jgi:hypothetical protein
MALPSTFRYRTGAPAKHEDTLGVRVAAGSGLWQPVQLYFAYKSAQALIVTSRLVVGRVSQWGYGRAGGDGWRQRGAG